MTTTAILSHWGAQLETEVSWLLEEPFLEALSRSMADVFSEIEKWDLRVGKVVLGFNADSMKVSIHAHADMADANRDSVHEDACTDSSSDVDLKVVGVWMCPECHTPQIRSRLHPEDGCPYGTIDHVMSS